MIDLTVGSPFFQQMNHLNITPHCSEVDESALRSAHLFFSADSHVWEILYTEHYYVDTEAERQLRGITTHEPHQQNLYTLKQGLVSILSNRDHLAEDRWMIRFVNWD